MQKILNTIQDQRITLGEWLLGFVGIFFIRFFLESLSSPTQSGIVPSDAYTFIHYGLFWIALTLGLILIVGYWSKNYALTAKVALFGLPAIWIAPIADFVLSLGHGFTQSYIFDGGKKLAFEFFTFFGREFTSGITFGIRIEMAIVLLGIGWYVWHNQKSILKSLLAMFSVYVFGFITLSLPSVIYLLSHNFAAGTKADTLNYLAHIISHSNLTHNTLHEGISSVPSLRFFDLAFDKLMSQILLIISVCLAGLLFWKIQTKKFLAIMRNCRPERIASYLSLLLCGAGFAYLNRLGNSFVWPDAIGIICLLIAWFSLWMHAVHVNDMADIDIDTISNPDRPLIKKELSSSDMREAGYLWLAIALLCSWAAGFYPFFMALIYIAAYYIYSAPPLRLRRFPLVPSFLISIAGLATIMSGFFFISASKDLKTFPMFLAAGIVIMITLAINVKDMKDIAGDKAAGIITLPILFKKHGSKVVAWCFAASFLLVPIFLSFYFLYIIALPTAVIGYRMVMKKPYREEPIFVLRFVFLALVIILYAGTYIIGYTYHLI